MDSAEVSRAVARCDSWLDTMRGPEGYGGPVAHWWQNCLQFTGAGMDWRYEGIILGYLNLYQRTGDDRWLAKARRAGDDLVRGQLPTGNYRNSSFEQNPYTGGTPHEAACDLALLRLAAALREAGEPDWQTYLVTAEKNLREYYIGQLWDDAIGCFWDHPGLRSFVPNKAATLAEAFLALASLTGDGLWAERYARPTILQILEHQLSCKPLDGAIHQSSVDGRFDARFFLYYVARCVPGLVAGYEWFGEERFVQAALRAVRFVLGQQYADGSFPQVVYPGGRVNRYPQWIAAVGDILRAMDMIRPYGLEADPEPTLDWLLLGQEPSGAFRTARGFASQISQRDPGDVPEFRDLLPVVGWNDKAFACLTALLPKGFIEWPRDAGAQSTRIDCTFRSRTMHYQEDDRFLIVDATGTLVYRWRKGDNWASVVAPEFRLK